MSEPNETRLHVTMGALLFLSTFLDPAMRKLMPAWKPPEVSFVTLVLGLVWVALFVLRRLRGIDDRLRVLDDRLARYERRTDALEDEARRRVR